MTEESPIFEATIEMAPDKETKGTIRIASPADDAAVATIYVNKFALGGKRPKRFEVVIRGYAE
jgi:hypothetical protein